MKKNKGKREKVTYSERIERVACEVERNEFSNFELNNQIKLLSDCLIKTQQEFIKLQNLAHWHTHKY